MSSRICVVPQDWTIETYRTHCCADGSHAHISYSELAERQKTDVVVFLQKRESRKVKDVVIIRVLPKPDHRWAGRQTPSRAVAGQPMNAGLSFRLGVYLAKRIRQRHDWAIVMQAQIRRRGIREEIPVEPPENENEETCTI